MGEIRTVSARALQAHAAEALICPITGSATTQAAGGRQGVVERPDMCVFYPYRRPGQAIGRSQVQSVYRFHFVIGFFVRGQSGQVLESESVGATCRLLVFSDGACLWYRGLASIAAMTHISRLLAMMHIRQGAFKFGVAGKVSSVHIQWSLAILFDFMCVILTTLSRSIIRIVVLF
jgi:hypothetical protein